MEKRTRHVCLTPSRIFFFVAALLATSACTNPFNKNNGNAEPYSGFKAVPGMYYWLDDRVKCKTMDESGFRAVVEFRSESEILYRKACQSETVAINSSDVKVSPYGTDALGQLPTVLSFKRGLFSGRAVKPTRKTIGEKAISWCYANQGGYRYDLLVSAAGTIQKPVKAKLIGVKSKFKKKQLVSLEKLGEVNVNVATTNKEKRVYSNPSFKLNTENVGEQTTGTFTGTLNGQVLPATYTCVDTFLTPSEPDELLAPRLVSAGHVSACGTHLGKTYCWGDRSQGQLANGNLSGYQLLPELTNVITDNVTQLSQASDFGCALASGSPFCWGRNVWHELGRGIATENEMIPANPSGLTDATAIATGGNHGCALRNGDVYCWGANTYGQVGTGSYGGSVSVPTLVTGSIDSHFTSVTAGVFHSCAATIDGDVYCWGQNGNGQLGLGAVTSGTAVPQKLASVNAVSLSARSNSTCAVTADGKVACWGHNNYGQVSGNGVADGNEPSPIFIPGLPGAVQSVSMGGHHACAVQDTQVYCWGSNISGELGRGSAANLESVGLMPIANASDVDCGTSYTMATTPDQTLGVGSNIYGQLGIGTTHMTGKLVPVAFP